MSVKRMENHEYLWDFKIFVITKASQGFQIFFFFVNIEQAYGWTILKLEVNFF